MFVEGPPAIVNFKDFIDTTTLFDEIKKDRVKLA